MMLFITYFMMPFLIPLSILEWRQPLWLLLVFQPILLWLVLRRLQQRKQQPFADSHLLPWIQVQEEKSVWQRLFSRDAAYSLAWLFFALSLAGPRLADDQNNQQETLLDIMMVIDLSQSMHAADIAPTRLRRATLETYEFLKLAKNTKVGVIVYAARPHLYVPLTTDFNALKFYLQNLDSLQLPTQGSDATAALNLARQELQNNKQERQQVLLWLTDGDIDDDINTDNANALEVLIKQASDRDINTYILGLGTSEGSAIPLANGGWLEVKGQGVVSHMNTALLHQLSQVGGGSFAVVSDDESDWEALYKKGMLENVAVINNKDKQQWQELYGWFLFPAMMFLVIALLPFSVTLLKQSSSTLVLLLTTLLLLGILPSPQVYAAEEKSYVQNDAKNYEVSVLQGIAAYKSEELGQSKRDFIHAVLQANTDEKRGVALHNLGNVLFQVGDYSNAAVLFSDALRYIPEQQETLDNQQLAIALYALLEKRRARSQSQGLNTPPTPDSVLLDLPDELPFMLHTKAINMTDVALPKIPAEEWTKLLDKGLEHLRLMEADKEALQQQKEHQQDIETARVHLLNRETKASNALWKRLFEIEEGFAGKLDKPKEVPGVQPW